MSDAGFAEAMYDEIYGLNCTIGQLTVENAKLREQLESIVGRSFRTADKMACLADENAKLRELVRDVVLLAPNRGADILRVEWSASDGSWLSIKDRMRELGVEV